MVESKFRQGHAKVGGRKAGAPNKTTVAVKDAILAAFDEVGGKDYLVEIARSEPKAFLTLLGKLVPAQVRVEIESSDVPLVVLRSFTGIKSEPERSHAIPVSNGEPPLLEARSSEPE